MALRTQDEVSAVDIEATFRVFRPYVYAGALRPERNLRYWKCRWCHEVSITAGVVLRGRSSMNCICPALQAGH